MSSDDLAIAYLVSIRIERSSHRDFGAQPESRCDRPARSSLSAMERKMKDRIMKDKTGHFAGTPHADRNH
jgi:hypothetical protein